MKRERIKWRRQNNALLRQGRRAKNRLKLEKGRMERKGRKKKRMKEREREMEQQQQFIHLSFPPSVNFLSLFSFGEFMEQRERESAKERESKREREREKKKKGESGLESSVNKNKE